MRLQGMLIAVLILSVVGFSGCASLEDLTGVSPSSRYDMPSDLYNRALAYYQQGQYSKALTLFHEYVGQYQDTPLYKVSLYYLAHCYQMTGDKDEALTIYSRVVDQFGEEDFWGKQALTRIAQIKDENAVTQKK